MLLLWMGLTAVAVARPATFSVRCVPEGAQVYHCVHGHDSKAPELNPVGESGSLLNLKVGDQSTVTLELQHPDCLPLRFNVDLNELTRANSNVWPLAGNPPIQMLYRSPLHRVQALLRQWAVALSLLALAGLALGLWLFRLRAARRAQQVAEKARQKADTINQMLVPHEENDPMLGALLDGYRLVEMIGEGGMARVYRAVRDEELELRRWVAIKILNSNLSNDGEALRRLERERQAYESLRHPHLVQLYGAGQNGPHIYMVMEFVKGQTLRAHIPPAGVGLRQALAWMTPVIQAVHYAHSKGVVHRDLKPENVMLSSTGDIKVMDLGLARGGDLAQVTATGALMGTPAYMAPEQVQGEFHAATDQYALGIMLYELLTGSVPYHDDNLINLALKHVTQPVPRLVEKRPRLVKTSAVLERMLAKDPAQRFPDLQSALKALGLAESVDGS